MVKPKPTPKNGSRRTAGQPTSAETLAKTKAREQEKIQEASRILRLAGCDTRLRILLFLEQVNSSAVEIRSEIKSMTDQAVSYQCSLLVGGGLISRKYQGKSVVYALTPTGAKLVSAINAIEVGL